MRAGAEHGEASYPATVAIGLAGWVSVLAREPDVALARCDDSMARAAEGNFEVGMFVAAVRGWAVAATGDVERGVREIATASDFLRGAGTPLFRPFHLALLADSMLMVDRFDEAVDHASEGLAAAQQTGEVWCKSELYRLRGVARHGLGEFDAARDDLHEAIRVATAQDAVAFLARAATDLAAMT
jgi:hypothetical protein